jgi:hypothetical protein
MPTIPGEVLEELRSNLAQLRLRDPERRKLVARTAFLFHRSEKTVYRQLAQVVGPKRCTRKDQGHARYPVESEFRRWIEMVAAIKLATLNRKGQHLSTAKAIALCALRGTREQRVLAIRCVDFGCPLFGGTTGAPGGWAVGISAPGLIQCRR